MTTKPLSGDACAHAAPGMDPETQAETVLGPHSAEAVPNALPPRVEQLWRLDHFAASVPFTNPMFVPVGPSPDLGLLHEAVAQVVRRHEALRTRLAIQNGRPVQIVEPWKASHLTLADIRRRELEDDRPDDPHSPVSQFTMASLDLYAQDGFRAQAFRDEEGSVTLGFVAHGFFSDAWSSQLLLNDFRRIYSALQEGGTPRLGPAASYIDYARSQRQSLARDLPARLSFWRKKLGDLPPAGLPYDHPKGGAGRGRSYFFIREDVLAGLAAAAAPQRVSLTLLLLAAFQLSLARWSGQSEVLSAAYTADRVRPEFQNTIGCLVTNMPVCSRLEPAQGFPAFLSGFAKEFYGSYPHRELSCEVYEAIFAPRKPFCATVFNFVPLQKRFSTEELLSLKAFDGTVQGSLAAKPAIYRDLYLGLAQYPNGLLGKLFYDAGLFSAQAVEVFIQHFRLVAEKIASDTNMTLRDLLH
jgi:hypothetical protein